MRFTQTIFTTAALVAAAFGLTIDSYPDSVVAGQTYTVKYSPADNTPVTFTLRKGDPKNLDTVATLTTTATGGTFQFTVPKDVSNSADYALEIKKGSEVNYTSNKITVSGGSGAASSGASGSATASASKSGSASASASGSATSAASGSASATATKSIATSARPSGTTSSASGPPSQTNAAGSLAVGSVAAMGAFFALFA
jgi:hypothetical protein